MPVPPNALPPCRKICTLPPRVSILHAHQCVLSICRPTVLALRTGLLDTRRVLGPACSQTGATKLGEAEELLAQRCWKRSLTERAFMGLVLSCLVCLS